MTAPAKRPAWLPNGCPDWCAYTDLHADRDFYEDRVHAGRSVKITLTAVEPPQEGCEVFDDPCTVDLDMEQHYREESPRIHLGRDGMPGLYLTLAEAEQLATALGDLIADADREV